MYKSRIKNLFADFFPHSAQNAIGKNPELLSFIVFLISISFTSSQYSIYSLKLILILLSKK